MPEELWLDLVSDAVGLTCLPHECHVDVTLHRWYGELRHIAPQHCELCSERKIVSVDTLQRTRRDDVVSTIVRWLEHFHPQADVLTASQPTSAQSLG